MNDYTPLRPRPNAPIPPERLGTEPGDDFPRLMIPAHEPPAND